MFDFFGADAITAILRIATRKSPLALWQAEHVASRLQAADAELRVEYVAMRTSGDRFQSGPLASVGGKGLFIKELEQALLAGRADIAVHSMKDVPVELAPQFTIAAMLAREDPRDVLITGSGDHLMDIPAGRRIGTSSLRRQTQLKALRPELEYANLRGNVGTRLAKLQAGDYDGVVLAAAGILRLGLAGRVTEYLPVVTVIPAIGQGAIGIECRSDAADVIARLAALNDAETRACVSAERAVSQRLGGDCFMPIAAHASCLNGRLVMRAMIGNTGGTEQVTAELEGDREDPVKVGLELGGRLLDKGGDRLLREFRSTS